MDVIYVLWLRQLKRYWRSRGRVIGALGQPLLFLLALGFGFGPVFRKAGQGDYIQFLAPGVIGMTILFAAVFSGIELIWDRQFGFMKEVLVAPVPRLTIVFVICLLAGFRLTHVEQVPLAVLFMSLIALMFTALGTAIASVMSDFQGFQLVINFLVMPMFFLSGALFPLMNLPKLLEILATIDPLSYGVDGIRAAFVGVAHFGIQVDLAMLFVLSALLLGMGSYLFSRIEL